MKKQIVILSLFLSIVTANNCMEDENQKKNRNIKRISDALTKLDYYCNIRAKNQELCAMAKSKLDDNAWEEVYKSNPAVLQSIDEFMQRKSDIKTLLQPNKRLYKKLQHDGYFSLTLSPNDVIEETEEKETFQRIPTLLITSIVLQSPQLESRLNTRITNLCSHIINDKVIKTLQNCGISAQNREELTKKYHLLLENPHKKPWLPTDIFEKEISQLISFLVQPTREKEGHEINQLIGMRVEELIRIKNKEEKNEALITATNTLQDKYEVDIYRQELNKKIQRKYSLEAIQNHLKDKLPHDTAAFMITQCACITNRTFLDIMITELQAIILEKMNPTQTTI